MSSGPIGITIAASPPEVHLDRDVLLTINVTAPLDVDVALAPLEGRLRGFVLNGTFDTEPVTYDGRTTRERQFRLTPVLADEYRLAPMAIVYTNQTTGSTDSGWFRTRAMIFDLRSPAEGKCPEDISCSLKPLWIRPPLRTMALRSVLAAVAAGAVILAWHLFQRMRRTIVAARMSPAERALSELDSLLAKGLSSRGLIKEFYLELTMIVRGYIEQAHGIRAPEQTTEEFLGAAGNNPAFGADVVQKLRLFLRAADLVKFAADRPQQTALDRAFVTAREYIFTDAATSARENPGR